MDCESLTEEEIREAAQELTLLQTSALSGATFGTTFGRPTATPPLASATPFQTSQPFSSFSNNRLFTQTPLGQSLQETPNKFPRHETQDSQPHKGKGKGQEDFQTRRRINLE